MASWLRSMGSTSVLLVLALSLMLTGCSGDKSGSDKKGDDKKGDKSENDKVTKENFNKLKGGMAEKEVTDILGKPTETEDVTVGNAKLKRLVWKSGNSSIRVDFQDGKVVSMNNAFVEVKVK
jgi:PBP1b-binding outer membrane lipoprotein LpoB